MRTSWERATIGLSLHHQQQRALCCSHLRLEAHHRIVHLHAHSRCKAQPRRCPQRGSVRNGYPLRMWSSRQARQAGQRTTRATGKAPRLVLEGDLLARLLGLVANRGLGFRAHSPELPATACVHAYARATLNRPNGAPCAGAPSYDWGGAAPTKRLFPLRHGIPCGMISHATWYPMGIPCDMVSIPCTRAGRTRQMPGSLAA